MISSSDILKASILIVDDQEANVSLLEQMLLGAGYVSIASTGDPHTVCDLHRKNRYSLILLALQMPGLDGFQVMERLKVLEIDGDLPVLVIAAQPDHKLRALKAGAKDFVSKPVDLAEVLMRVHNMLEVRLLHLETKRLCDQVVAEQKVSEQLLRVFRSGPGVVSINTVADGRIIDANEEHCRFFGYSREEIVGRSVRDINLWANPEDRAPVMERLLKEGAIRGFETKQRRRSGEVRDVLASLELIELDGESEPVLISMFTDITEGKQPERALRASEVSYRRLFEAAKDGILILEADTGRISDVNPFLLEMLGFSHDEMVGKTIWEISPFKDIVSNKAKFVELQQKGYVRYENLPLEARDGRKIAVEFVSNVYPAGDSNVIQCNIRDITERNQAERALRASEVSYRRLFEAAKDGILILEADTGRISDVNPFLLEMLGFSHDEMVGKTIWEISPFKDIVSNKAKFVQLQHQGYVRYEGLPLETRDGRKIAVEFVSNVYPAGDSNVIQCNIRDITARKGAEEQLKTSFKEVGDLNTEIRNFYHTLSHELKTPLTSAREFVSIVMDGLAGPLNATQLEYLGIAKEGCDQLRLYINDLLDVTRLETGKMSIEYQVLPLAALVERVVEMLAPAAAGKDVSLSCHCQPDLPDVPIDKQRILQVLINLTTNAIKFTPAGGHIRLSLIEAPANPECLQVDVCDTGRGIPSDQLDAIFNRLYQANHNVQTVESRSGLGLGLYICQELVCLHGGLIWVESEMGKGSTFSFTVPKQAMTKGAHVLIIDDDYATRETLCRALEDKNFEVTTAEGGSEALQLMGQRTPDIVVLDLMMAGLDGPSTLKEIRMNWGLIPVIVYTGYPVGDLMRQAMESSPFTLLVKPCPPKRFVETVRRMRHTHETRYLKKNAMAGQALAAQSTENHFTSEDQGTTPSIQSVKQN